MAATTQTDLFEVMSNCRSMRRLSPRPVPEAVLVKLVEAGTRAPSAANAQNWRFVVVRDREVMTRIAQPWRRGIALLTEVAERAPARPGEDLMARSRTLDAVAYLAEHFEETPALICVCVQRDAAGEAASRSPVAVRAAVRHLGLWATLRLGRRARRNQEQELWASAYPAAQNILLAARAFGLGAVMTVPKVLAPPGTYEKILGLPRGVLLAAIIPVGYPLGRFGPVGRLPVDAFLSWDHYRGNGGSTAA
jgi:nitroreductase